MLSMPEEYDCVLSIESRKDIVLLVLHLRTQISRQPMSTTAMSEDIASSSLKQWSCRGQSCIMYHCRGSSSFVAVPPRQCYRSQSQERISPYHSRRNYASVHSSRWRLSLPRRGTWCTSRLWLLLVIESSHRRALICCRILQTFFNFSLLRTENSSQLLSVIKSRFLTSITFHFSFLTLRNEQDEREHEKEIKLKR